MYTMKVPTYFHTILCMPLPPPLTLLHGPPTDSTPYTVPINTCMPCSNHGPNLYIYKIPEVFVFARSLLPNSSWTDGHIWTADTSLEPAWHVDGFFRSKISVPTAMEWPETQTCPKSSRSAIISETMRRIEILRALYVIQLLILVSGGWNPPDTRTHFNAFQRTI